MELAKKVIQEKIDCYEYWIRAFYPYFKEKDPEKRLQELKDTHDQLKRALAIILNDASALPIHGVSDTVCAHVNITSVAGIITCQECNRVLCDY